MTPYFLVCAALSIIEAFVCSAVIFISRRKGAEAEVWLRLQVGAAVGWVLGGSLQAGLFLPSPPDPLCSLSTRSANSPFVGKEIKTYPIKKLVATTRRGSVVHC